MELTRFTFGSWNVEFDHEFNTFEGIEYTCEKPNSKINLLEFINLIQNTN